MSDNGTRDGDSSSSVSRRRFVRAAGATGVAAGIAGCADFVGGDGGDGGSTGDGSDGGGGGDTTTVKWGFDPVAVQNNGPAIKDALRENGLPENIEIEFVPRNQDTGQARANYNRLLSAGETEPDMFLMDNGWTNIFIQRGQLQSLSESLPEDLLSDVSENYFTAFTDTARDPSSGDLYGVPVFPDFPTMQYRKDLVEEAGYNPESDNWATEPMTWEKWSNIAADVYDNSDTDFGFTTQWDIYEGTSCCTFNEVMSSWGGAYFGGRDNLFGPVGDRPVTVNRPEVVDALNMMRKFVHDEDFGGQFSSYGGGFTPTNILGWNEEPSRAPFAEGNAVFHRNWPYSLALTGRNPEETDDPALGENLGAMPIPYAVSESDAAQPGTGGTTAALGGWHMTVNPNSGKDDAVTEVIRAAMQPDFQLKLLSIQGWLPPRPELFNSDEAQNVPVVGRYMDTLQVAGNNTMPRPVTAVWSDQSSKIAQQANRAVGQEASSKSAMQTLEKDLQATESS
ncbi:extracellular solute-binding protein [Haloarcula pellucida]|uniref:Sugar ABC transporter substrate-binding protein n=1 Tax=Haloarcula pellucida TaxID=1427151 RepID=A0A830GIS1_9EURY|nr:extracellular solute-binding protein [Halomicroarcula pellucida]MBX0347477.1 extracellular solute-binding protein [Halomicroarcula pellucida]GGN88858.1 sugar ABC transporter substrate-binding protein [Halomicroarcula pellucida]